MPATSVGRPSIERRHTYLPVLGQTERVEFDLRTGDVRYAHLPAILATLLEACGGIERSDAVTG